MYAHFSDSSRLTTPSTPLRMEARAYRVRTSFWGSASVNASGALNVTAEPRTTPSTTSSSPVYGSMMPTATGDVTRNLFNRISSISV